MEVLIVLAILGLAFTISYATANHALIAARTAEEHSEALQLLDAQVELLRQAASNGVNVFLPGDGGSNFGFCMQTGAAPVPTYPGTAPYFNVPLVSNNDPLTQYPAPCVSGLYHEAITYEQNPPSGAEDVFTFYIRWAPLGSGHEIQQEKLTYKLHNSVTAGS